MKIAGSREQGAIGSSFVAVGWVKLSAVSVLQREATDPYPWLAGQSCHPSRGLQGEVVVMVGGGCGCLYQHPGHPLGIM